MKYTLRSLILVTAGTAGWLALAVNLRALAILVLPVMLFIGSAYAFRVYSGQRYLRAICFLVAMISMIAFYVASLGPFYMFAPEWKPDQLSPVGKGICGLYNPLMILLPRYGNGLWSLIYDRYLLEWIEYRQFIFNNLESQWPYNSR